MRLTWMVLFPASLSLAAFSACSSSSTEEPTTTSDAGSGSKTDAGSNGGSDSGGGNQGTDAGGNQGTDSGQGDTDSGGGGMCNLASDCPGAVCCGTIPITGGTVPNCTTGTITTVCQPPTNCKTSLGTTCSGVQTIRLCSHNSDCTESADSQCCTFGGGDGGSLTFCANALVSAFGGGTCM